MKSLLSNYLNSRIRVVALSLAMACLFLAAEATAAEYHVVIGSFVHESNARRFTNSVRSIFSEVSCSYSEHTKLYYVSVLKTPRREDAQNLIAYLKREKGFRDAWMLMKADEGSGITIQPVVTYSHGKARFQATEPSRQSTIPVMEASTRERELNDDRYVPAVKTHTAEVNWTVARDLSFVRNIDEAQSSVTSYVNSNAKVLSFIVEDERGNSIPTEVMLVDFEKVKKIATFDAGEKIAMRSSKPNQMVTFVCERLGYSQETRMFNMDHLSRGRDIVKNNEGVWEIRIKLKPMELHDIAFLNNTIFYKDAAVLQPSSQKELDELVAMMKGNPEYKIVVHSHCNRNSKRTIRIPEGDNEYFDLDASVEAMASDKKLTKARGELVRDYLVSHGVDRKRINVVAWGSMEPAVSPTSKDAAELNERLEIELVD